MFDFLILGNGLSVICALLNSNGTQLIDCNKRRKKVLDRMSQFLSASGHQFPDVIFPTVPQAIMTI
ncbi:hypothetical protein M758_1G261200 [Ceratodon purpureus]|uniref:Uncharacterized protein n=1 Tax=Ceratodon purpureus TaxID=3225 RepID=A0A8T0JCJ9_CERPU|nr:hypothetical protein KC19_1G268600 [Ceratodon purpureus]KAG0631529.1 hypothetical protein M758_1G261200 [Ceratodon purpureus]